MVATSKIILPYEPGYVANKEADKRRKETKERLRQREREFAERQQPPSIVPERLRASSVGGFVTVEVSIRTYYSPALSRSTTASTPWRVQAVSNLSD
jgi:hypothetical protein